MNSLDVEQIARDVIKIHGLTVLMVSVESLPTGWRIVVVDAAGRVLTHDLKATVPTAVRTELDGWLEGGAED